PQRVATGLAFSNPIDPYVYGALRGHCEVDADAYRAAHPEEFTPEAIAADDRELRPVQFEFLVGAGLPSWIRVTTPHDASVEEVASTLYGDPAASYRLTAAPPLFGLPAADVPVYTRPGSLSATAVLVHGATGTRVIDREERRIGLLPRHAAAWHEALRRSGRDPAELARAGGPVEELGSPLAQGLADELALRASARVLPTPGATRELILDRMAFISSQLERMEEPAGELVHPRHVARTAFLIGRGGRRQVPYVAPESYALRQRIAAARARVNRRLEDLAAGGAGDVRLWDGQTRGQLEIVGAAGNGLAMAARQARGWAGSPGIYELVVDIADAYVAAAEISDLYEPARARLDSAERKSILFPVTATELVLSALRAALDEARTSELTSVEIDTASSRMVDHMDRTEQELRRRLARLRPRMLHDPERAGAELQEILEEVQALQTGVTLAVDLDTIDRVWQALHDTSSVLGEFRALWGGGNELLRNGQRAALALGNEWHEILLEWRFGDRDEARRMLAEPDRRRRWRRWLSDMRSTIEDHQAIDQLITFTAMVGIAVISGGSAGYVGGLAGAAWGSGVGLAVEIGTEALVFTSMSYPLNTRDPSLGDFATHLGTNLLCLGGGRLLAL